MKPHAGRPAGRTGPRCAPCFLTAGPFLGTSLVTHCLFGFLCVFFSFVFFLFSPFGTSLVSDLLLSCQSLLLIGTSVVT